MGAAAATRGAELQVIIADSLPAPLKSYAVGVGMYRQDARDVTRGIGIPAPLLSAPSSERDLAVESRYIRKQPGFLALQHLNPQVPLLSMTSWHRAAVIPPLFSSGGPL